MIPFSGTAEDVIKVVEERGPLYVLGISCT